MSTITMERPGVVGFPPLETCEVLVVLECQICGEGVDARALVICRRCGTVYCAACEGVVDSELCAPCDEEETRDLFVQCTLIAALHGAGMYA